MKQLNKSITNTTVIDFRPTHSVFTASGRKVDIYNPNPADINIEDIAWSLSRTATFNGHTADMKMHSVANLSNWASMYVWTQTGDAHAALCALLHKASMAYIGNIKQQVMDLGLFNAIDRVRAIEAGIVSAIYDGLKIPTVTNRAAPVVSEAYEQAEQQALKFLTLAVRKGMDMGEPTATSKKMGPPQLTGSVAGFESFTTTFHLLRTKVNHTTNNQEETIQ